MIKEQRVKLEGEGDQYRINERGNVEDQDGQEYDEIDTNVIIDQRHPKYDIKAVD